MQQGQGLQILCSRIVLLCGSLLLDPPSLREVAVAAVAPAVCFQGTVPSSPFLWSSRPPCNILRPWPGHELLVSLVFSFAFCCCCCCGFLFFFKCKLFLS